MKGRIKHGCSIFGIPSSMAGSIIEVEPMLSAYDKTPIQGLYKDKKGKIWDSTVIEILSHKEKENGSRRLTENAEPKA